MGAAAAIFAGAIVALAHVLPADVRLWLGHLFLVAGYWLPALLVTRSPQRFEAWLRRTESFGPFGSFRSFGSFWELAYLCCYPFVPAAFLTVYRNGSVADVDRFWTSVLAAGYVCYISLPWLVSRPPRIVMRSDANVSNDANDPNDAALWIRHMNLKVLDRLSHGWNTFPSGHVAVAFAAAFSTFSVSPPAGLAFAIVAIGIALGSVSGRYHYMVDALAGVVVGIVMPLITVSLLRI